jgi:hypothetical protein
MHRTEVISLLHRGKQLAAKMKSSDPQRLAFVGVYPLDLSQPSTQVFLHGRGLQNLPATGRAYHVRTFEVDRSLVEADVWMGETELTNTRSFFTFDDESLVEHLAQIGVPLESLEPPFKSDYPI